MDEVEIKRSSPLPRRGGTWGRKPSSLLPGLSPARDSFDLPRAATVAAAEVLVFIC
jgi:hypothetical protein